MSAETYLTVYMLCLAVYMLCLAVLQSVPFWFALMFLEILVARWMGKRPARVNDSFSSISAGMIQQMSKYVHALI